MVSNKKRFYIEYGDEDFLNRGVNKLGMYLFVEKGYIYIYMFIYYVYL